MSKIRIEFRPEIVDMLHSLAKHDRRSKEEARRKSIGLYHYMHPEKHSHALEQESVALGVDKKISNRLKWI